MSCFERPDATGLPMHRGIFLLREEQMSGVFIVVLRKKVMLMLMFVCSVSSAAPNYYPMQLSNVWVLESLDGTQRVTYTLEEAGDDFPGNPEVRKLKMTSETLGVDASTTTLSFVERDSEGVKLHKLVVEPDSVFGEASVAFSPPAVFFPFPLRLGDTWEIAASTEVNLLGPVKLTTVAEVVALEDVVTPTGTFKDCFKIRLRSRTVSAFIISRSTFYQWLAPDVGPVKFQTDQDIVFELVSSNLLYDVTGDGVVNILDLTFVSVRIGTEDPEADVNNDGIVNIQDLQLIVQYIGG